MFRLLSSNEMLLHRQSEFLQVQVMASVVYLMYHELELRGRALCQGEPGYVRYVLPVKSFESQLEWLKTDGWRGVNVSEALLFPKGSAVALTFDDGSESDVLAAAPILNHFGFGATFYITTGFLNRRGYLSSEQLRELSRAGFEIGCHSMTHAYLPDLQEAEIVQEVVTAKERLEDIIGKAVEHFSCPGGRYNARVQLVARRGGYRTLSTSLIRANRPTTDPFELGRVAIMRNTSFDGFQRICRNQGLWRMRAGCGMRAAAKKVVGNSFYDTLRALILGQHKVSST